MNKLRAFLCALCLTCFGCADEVPPSVMPEDGAVVTDTAPNGDAGREDTPTNDSGASVPDADPPEEIWTGPLETGDLIRGTGPAVYFLAGSGRRWLFPNETTFYAWYPDFTAVRRISELRLNMISIGGNVTFRAGTWLAKITTDPKVYAISRCGELHWLETEAVAFALYGPFWNMGEMVIIPQENVRRTRDVPDAFFTNYVVGASIATPIHPNGTLIQYAGGSERYLVMDGRKRRITEAGFRANRFNQWFVVTTTISYPDSADPPVTAYERDLSDPSCP